ncbi:hypothetical protein BS78_10G013700 [Paspalum vaginatum]|nr:hypothetical protein BS78_10G013700 [Paspalum vaginatum]
MDTRTSNNVCLCPIGNIGTLSRHAHAYGLPSPYNCSSASMAACPATAGHIAPNATKRNTLAKLPSPCNCSSASTAGLMAPKTKRYTLAALFTTLAVAVVVTVFFVVLCPARISFSVAHTGSHRSGATTGGDSLQLSLTLAARNPSRRATVTYRSMFVDVSNSTAAPWDILVSATVTTAMPLEQPTNSVATVDAEVNLADGPWTAAFTGNMTRSFSVMVTAQARFKVGVAWTRLYDIKVSCGPVSFFHDKAKPSGSGGGGLAEVRCI